MGTCLPHTGQADFSGSLTMALPQPRIRPPVLTPTVPADLAVTTPRTVKAPTAESLSRA